jgi:hypothetical protein
MPIEDALRMSMIALLSQSAINLDAAADRVDSAARDLVRLIAQAMDRPTTAQHWKTIEDVLARLYGAVAVMRVHAQVDRQMVNETR